MIQLFKAKSLKNNTKTGQGAGVGASVQGAGVGAGVRGAGVGAGVRGAGVGAGVQGARVGASVRGAGVGASVQGAGVSAGVQSAGVSAGARGAGVGAGVQGAGVGAGVRGAGVSAGVQGAGVGAGANLNSNLNERTQEKEKSKGRSMVEMLGVLAIIGVLSIGGIQGYTMAMRRYRANEVLNLANKYALLVYTSCQNQIMSEKMLDIGGHDVLAGIYEEVDLYYWYCDRVPFSDSGLGPLPQGVKEIGSLRGNLNSLFLSTDSDDIRIISRSSGDIILVPMVFEDKALCETVLAITGGSGADSVDSYGTMNPCDPTSHPMYDYPLNAVVFVNN